MNTSPSELRSDWRIFVDPKLAKVKQSAHEAKLAVRRAVWHSQDGWRRLTAGMELDDLWSQFKSEAEASARPFKQEVDPHAAKSWTHPFKVFAAISSSILKKLSPPRRVFLLLTIVLAVFSIVGLEFLFFPREVELLLAFVGLLLLLVMVLGDHISMKRDIEIARFTVPQRLAARRSSSGGRMR